MIAGTARVVAGIARFVVAMVLGLVTALLTLLVLPVVALAVVVAAPRPSLRRRVAHRANQVGRWLVGLERRRLAAWAGEHADGPFSSRRMCGYLAARIALGLVGGYLGLILLVGALVFVVAGLWVWAFADSMVVLAWPGAQLLTSRGLLGAVVGALQLVLAVLCAAGVVASERWLFRWLVRAGSTAQLERRVAELTVSRAGILRAVDEERRRIERDLHDGVQQRVVALSLVLARLGRPGGPALDDRGTALLRQAQQESRQLIAELREIAWRVYPAVLDEHGLVPALHGLAERAGLPVEVHDDLGGAEVDRPRQTVAYFVVREAVTNAAKHAGAHSVEVTLERDESQFVVRVRDDGRGGADPQGSGLSGLARRVAAVDGTLSVDSPHGGPTTVLARLPLD